MTLNLLDHRLPVPTIVRSSVSRSDVLFLDRTTFMVIVMTTLVLPNRAGVGVFRRIQGFEFNRVHALFDSPSSTVTGSDQKRKIIRPYVHTYMYVCLYVCVCTFVSECLNSFFFLQERRVDVTENKTFVLVTTVVSVGSYFTRNNGCSGYFQISLFTRQKVRFVSFFTTHK